MINLIYIMIIMWKKDERCGIIVNIYSWFMSLLIINVTRGGNVNQLFPSAINNFYNSYKGRNVRYLTLKKGLGECGWQF